MAVRKTPLVTGQIYHVYNRGVDKRKIFLSNSDRRRFILAISHYKDFPHIKFSLTLLPLGSTSLQTRSEKEKKPIVEIINYCLMPNHFHQILKQLKDGGISEYLRKMSLSYATFFNTKYGREGSLFQGPFKAVHVESKEQLIHLSRYIHLNPVISSKTNTPLDKLEEYPWSSYREYLDLDRDPICNKSLVLESFAGADDYREFVRVQVTRDERELVRPLTLEKRSYNL